MKLPSEEYALTAGCVRTSCARQYSVSLLQSTAAAAGSTRWMNSQCDLNFRQDFLEEY